MLMSRFGSSAASRTKLGRDPVRQLVVDLLAEEDDPMPEQTLEKLVAYRKHRGLCGPPEYPGWQLFVARHGHGALLTSIRHREHRVALAPMNG